MPLSFPIPFKGRLYVSFEPRHTFRGGIFRVITYRGERFIRVACFHAIFTPHDWNADDHLGPRP